MKKIIFSLLVFIGMLAAAGCSANRSKTLADFPEMLTWFSEQEVEDLQNMTERFEREIGIAADASDEERASGLAAFNQRVLAFMEEPLEDRNHVFPLKKEQLMGVYDTIHISTFRKSWRTSISWQRDYQNKQAIAVNIAPKGSFMTFLAGFGKEYPLFAPLYEDMYKAGGFGPNWIKVLFFTLTEEELKDPRVRLIYTVYYVTWGMFFHTEYFTIPEYDTSND